MYNLKKFKWDITAVTNGMDAISAVKDNKFDLILMDLMLPEMSGIEITKEIRQMELEKAEESKVPIIALTANTLDNDRDKCMEVGMNDYLAKPFTSNQLIDKVTKFIPTE